MLKTPAPFPQVGSYALLVDANLPESQQRAELVRILRRYRMDREAPVAIAFPLRSGASGNVTTTVDQLIDGTPLTKAEERELADLQRSLAGRANPRGSTGVRHRPTKASTRAEALRKRLVFSQLLGAELAKLHAQEGRELTDRGVPRSWNSGSRLPRHAA